MSQGKLSKQKTSTKNEKKKSSHQETCEAKIGCFFKGLKIFGDEWNLFIISILANDEKRFCDLQRGLHNINPVTLTNRLKNLQEQGFIERKAETIDKLSVCYSLTSKGKAMIPIIKEIEKYAKKYL